LKSVAEYPNLIAELLRRGYTDDAVRKICGENLLRVWSAVEQTARDSGGTK
jgi:membrane dipeptidase